jgi:hypothetical protein
MTPEEAIKRGKLMVRWGESAQSGTPIRLRCREPNYPNWINVVGTPDFDRHLEYEEIPVPREGYATCLYSKQEILELHPPFAIYVREVEEPKS